MWDWREARRAGTIPVTGGGNPRLSFTDNGETLVLLTTTPSGAAVAGEVHRVSDGARLNRYEFDGYFVTLAADGASFALSPWMGTRKVEVRDVKDGSLLPFNLDKVGERIEGRWDYFNVTSLSRFYNYLVLQTPSNPCCSSHLVYEVATGKLLLSYSSPPPPASVRPLRSPMNSTSPGTAPCSWCDTPRTGAGPHP